MSKTITDDQILIVIRSYMEDVPVERVYTNGVLDERKFFEVLNERRYAEQLKQREDNGRNN